MTTLRERTEAAEAAATQLAAQFFMLQEGYADLEAKLAVDDRGWSKFDESSENGFTFEFLQKKATECELSNALNPLIKRGLTMRSAFIWGEGVEISVRDEATTGQEVGEWVKKFLKDRSNRHLAEITGQTTLETMLGTTGECYLALPTDLLSGRVQVRPIPMRQIPQIISDPEDEFTAWYYLRQWTIGKKEHKAFYPALGYSPKKKPAVSDASFGEGLDGIEIKWGQPVKRIAVNEVRGRGLGDAVAALPWAYAYKEFLESWHKIMKSMATFSWIARTRGDKASQAAQQLIQRAAAGGTVGATAVVDPNTRLEAISKSGAVFDSTSGQPIAAMVATAMGLPVTLLLSDPGVTGARAVAETLTEPTKREFQLRQAVWDEALRDIIGYVIEVGVRSKNLKGKAEQLPDRIEVALENPKSGIVIVDWPPLDSVAMADRVNSIEKAWSTNLLPHLTIARELLKALGVANIDEVMDQITDDQGNFLPPEELAQALTAPDAVPSTTPTTPTGSAE